MHGLYYYLAEMPNTALALSSLDVGIKGITLSGRDVVPMLQCEALDPHEIVTESWNIQMFISVLVYSIHL